MKRRILILVIIAGFCPFSVHAQKTKPGQCDSLRAMFDQSLVMLDSLVGSNNELQRRLDTLMLEVSEKRDVIKSILEKSEETATVLMDARKLIVELMDQINKLEAEVKRLSDGKSKGKKGT